MLLRSFGLGVLAIEVGALSPPRTQPVADSQAIIPEHVVGRLIIQEPVVLPGLPSYLISFMHRPKRARIESG